MGGERSENASAPVEQRAIALWDVLTFLAGPSALGGALGAASFAHLSGFRLALSVVWAVLLGLASIAGARIVGGRLLDRSTSRTALALVYAGAALWILSAIVIAAASTPGLLALLA